MAIVAEVNTAGNEASIKTDEVKIDGVDDRQLKLHNAFLEFLQQEANTK